jgi:hypothetical protein
MADFNKDRADWNTEVSEALKGVTWFLVHLFMGVLGISFDGPIPVAEDNAAICNTGKLGHSI